MALTAGSRLGRYEIINPLGAGGMGEVYRARDTRLDREVAIKILPESVARDPERLARFDREAKAVAALSHPNILALHDAGTEEGVTFAVMELLDGESLRERLVHGPLPVRRAIETTVQIAKGLAAAHAKGLIHRDLKPDNVFLVSDGQLKILDFGLAKAADPADGSGATATRAAMTDPGTVLGTVGYMAPEQVRGHALDARTDLFALGAVLYEMVTGQRAFQRETAAETMTAILREDPADLPALQLAQAPALDRIIRHCLEKNPAERFQSAKDVAFALEALSGTTSTSGATGASGPRNELSRTNFLGSGASLIAAALAFVTVAIVAAWATGYLHVGRTGSSGAGISEVTYQPVTFGEGFVFAARFARDGRTVVYSADWENQKKDIFLTSLDSPGARALGYENADLLSVSPDGALAILVESIVPSGNPYARRGTIARASLTGGAPRKELDRVTFADFAPDGSLAVSRQLPDAVAPTLEWPQGKPILDAEAQRAFEGNLTNPRLSPSGKHVAVFGCASGGCTVRITDQSGRTVAASRSYYDWWGLAWAPGGKEVWFSVAESSGRQCTVFAMDLAGHERMIFRAPGALTVHDISTEGRLLASFDQVVHRLEQVASTAAPIRDLSWKEGGVLYDVSANGVLLFGEGGDSGGANGSVFVRGAADAEPTRISDGFPLALSPDGTTALVHSHGTPVHVSVVPVSGLARQLDVGPMEDVRDGAFLNDGRLLLEIKRPGAPWAVHVGPAAGGPFVPYLPPGVHLIGPNLVSPTGDRVLVFKEGEGGQICTLPPTGTAACTPVPAALRRDQVSQEQPAGWTADGRSLFVYRRFPVPVAIEKVDMASGRREPFMTLKPATAAVSGLINLFVTPSGTVVYNYGRVRSSVYVISGLK
jgi:hypothetical protein